SCGSHQPRQTSVLVYSHLDVAVLRRDNTLGDGERSLGWYLEEGGHEDRFLIRGVVRGMDVAAPRVDEHGACRVVPLCTVISRNVYQLTLHDVDEVGSWMRVPRKAAARLYHDAGGHVPTRLRDRQ